MHAQFSPDGSWIAYCSDESGAPQVYLVDYPDFSQKVQVTRETASMPRWSRDGSELLVMSPAREILSIAVDLVEGEWQIGSPQPLFRTGIGDYSIRTHQYDASTDGETIVALESSYRQRPYGAPITVVTDWRKLLEERRR